MHHVILSNLFPYSLLSLCVLLFLVFVSSERVLSQFSYRLTQNTQKLCASTWANKLFSIPNLFWKSSFRVYNLFVLALVLSWAISGHLFVMWVFQTPSFWDTFNCYVPDVVSFHRRINYISVAREYIITVQISSLYTWNGMGQRSALNSPTHWDVVGFFSLVRYAIHISSVRLRFASYQCVIASANTCRTVSKTKHVLGELKPVYRLYIFNCFYLQ